MKTNLNLIIVAILLLLSPLAAYPQVKGNPKQAIPATNENKLDASQRNILAGSGGLTTGETVLEGTEGNIYFGSDWPKGIINLRDGSTIEDRRLRYDIYADQMQMTDGKDTLALAKPEEINSLSFDGHTFIYQPYECSGLVKQGYFEVLVTGKSELLLKRSVSFHIEGNGDGRETYLITECYFLKKGENPAMKIMCSKKSALEVFSEHRDEIERYMKDTGRKVKTPEDLKALVEYYNSLE